MPDLEAHTAALPAANRAFDDLHANPVPTLVLMTSSSEFP